MSKVTIVMYHYVRPIANSRWPGLKGLEVDSFRRQLDFLSSRFTIITAEELVSSVQTGDSLVENSCLLTFDDGYKDHITYVLPELVQRKIQGSFFPSALAVSERCILDVNRIHYILASCTDFNKLVQDLNLQLRAHGFDNAVLQGLWTEYGIAAKYDGPEVTYVKKLLQFVLPKHIRVLVIEALFNSYVALDAVDLAEELYMCESDARDLVSAGMYVGSHGYRHIWLDTEPKGVQEVEVAKSLAFLNRIGARTTDWIMCYPHGAYNNDTIEVIKKHKCAVGLTTNIGEARLAAGSPYMLPRLNTNDFPR